MLKRNMRTALVTSVLTLLPAAAGLILWDKLPERMATHWNFAGEADGYSSRTFAVVGIPLILLALQWLCLVLTSLDKKNQEQSGKVTGMVMWIIPIVAVVVMGLMYAVNLGIGVRIERVMYAIVGVMFAVIGNYLPKCKPNRTIGIRVPWTLASEEVWVRTHRFAGPIWVICGAAVALCAVMPGGGVTAVMVTAMLAAMAVVPVVYAWRISKK